MAVSMPGNVSVYDPELAQNTTGFTKREINNDLGKSEFLQLLAAQMQYQDPLEPQKDTAFVAQLAQFSSLQQMQDLNASMSLYQSYGMVGRLATAYHTNADFTQENITGIVNKVYNKNGTTYALLVEAGKDPDVYGREVKTTEIYGVTDVPIEKAPEAPAPVAKTPAEELLELSSLIGLVARGAVPKLDDDGKPVLDADGNPEPQYFEGIVTGVISRGGTQYLIVGNELQVQMKDVYDIDSILTGYNDPETEEPEAPAEDAEAIEEPEITPAEPEIPQEPVDTTDSAVQSAEQSAGGSNTEDGTSESTTADGTEIEGDNSL
ncbi:MAG: hypothetical protein LBN97_03475 [Oscillospiraceae bacterium]|jgi:hypothetical protein|nr:hypothetical protein [Oscillospiraceae bacterium]